jgi:hypothetical protein
MRQHLVLLRFFVCLAALCSTALQVHANGTVDASLSHHSFPLERGARLTITVSGAGNSAAIELPEIRNIRFHNPSKRSQRSIGTGGVFSSISHSYIVQALVPGNYTIPPILITAGGQTYNTKPINFEVTGAGQQNSGQSDNTDRTIEDAVFFRITETGSHYPGEIVPITIQAYFSQEYRADSISLPAIRGDGVVMPELHDKPVQTQESVGGRMYSVLTWETSLSGIKVGKHPITFTLDASLLIPSKRRSVSPFGGSSPFEDSVFDSFFGNYQRRPVSVVSPEIVFNVLPLPTDNRPENFTGAIGDFQLKAAVNPVVVEVGEPLTLSMEISGRGNFDRVEAPVFPDSPDWKKYSPTSNFSEQGHSYSGTKFFEQAIVAKSDAIEQIPSLSFSYFDPQRQSYVTRTSDPIAIKLKQSTTPTIAKVVQPAEPAEQQTPDTDIVQGFLNLAPIHLETGSFNSAIVPLFKRGWFITVCGVCILSLLTLWFFRMRYLNIEKHPEIQLKQHKKMMLLHDLKQVEQARTSGNGPSFLSLSRTTIQNQLGLLWNIEPTAISLADLASRLPSDSQLPVIFSAAEEAAYGGGSLSVDKMQDYFIKLKAELEGLV